MITEFNIDKAKEQAKISTQIEYGNKMYKPLEIETLEVVGVKHVFDAMRNPFMSHDKSSDSADLKLASNLVKAGDEHAKAIRGIMVYAKISFGIGFMVEYDTYRIGIETLSTSSTMHMNHKGLKGVELAEAKQANLPNVYYTRTSMISYQTLRRIHKQRRNHRHPDWQIFCDWIETLPSFKELIKG